MLRNLLPEIASGDVLEEAFDWLCDRRKQYSHNDEVWLVRERWAEIKPQLKRQLLASDYSDSIRFRGTYLPALSARCGLASHRTVRETMETLGDGGQVAYM